MRISMSYTRAGAASVPPRRAIVPPSKIRSQLEQPTTSIPTGRETPIYALAAIIGSTVWIWPHLARIRDVPDRGDPIFSAWRLARFAHQLLTDPARLFDGNIFHPLPLTLTYSDPTVLQGLIATPLLWAGVDPLVAANLLFLLAFPACGAAFFAAAFRFTGDPRSSLVAGLLGAWHPFHGEHYSHLELQWFMFVPLAIVGLCLVLAKPTVARGALLGAAIAAQWLASMYFGLMLASVLVPCGLILAAAWRVRPSMPLARALGASVAVALPAFALTALPYRASLPLRGERSIQETTWGSAMPADYLTAHRRMASYQWISRAENRPERELFPGFSPLALAGVGVIAAPPAIATALAGAGLLAFDASLGYNGLTYPALRRALAPYRGIRVPARFAAVAGALLALLAAFGARSLLDLVRPGAPRHLACALLALAVLLDLRLRAPLVRYWPTVPGVYAGVTPAMVLAELPRSHAVDYMYFSTRHHAQLLGGYSGFIPRQEHLDRSFEGFPSPDALTGLRHLGATHLTYNCAFELSPVRCRLTLERLDASPQLEIVARERWSGAEVSLYRFR